MAERNFRVIIVGAGPVGLAAGLALGAAGIDFVILEQQAEVCKNQGICIFLWPQTVRILDQLGLGERVRADAMPGTRRKTNMELDGTVLSSNNLFEIIERNHGYGCLGFQRPKLMDLLLDHLPQRETRLRTGAQVTDIVLDDAAGGVRVVLADGSVEEGSIVLGADGVHSRTRQMMQDLARRAGVDIDARDLDPMTTRVQSMYGYSEGAAALPAGVERGNFIEGRGTHRATQMIAYGDRVDWILFRTLPRPTQERRRYSDAETEAMARDFFDDCVAPGLKFKELWESRTWARLVNQEEGTVRRWYWKRILLVGDASTKMTSMAGQGFNDSVGSVAMIVNALHRLLRTDPAPTTEALERLFADFQKDRWKASKATSDFSALVIRTATWDNLLYWILDKWIAPLVGGDPVILEKKIAPITSNSPILDFVPFTGKHGRIPWAIRDVKAET